MSSDIFREMCPGEEPDNSGSALNVYFRQILVSPPLPPGTFCTRLWEYDRSLFPIFHGLERFAGAEDDDD